MKINEIKKVNAFDQNFKDVQMIGKWLSSEAEESAIESEAKWEELEEDILKRETPASVVAPAETNGGTSGRASAAERSRVGAFMDLKTDRLWLQKKTDQIIWLSISGEVKGGTKRTHTPNSCMKEI